MKELGAVTIVALMEAGDLADVELVVVLPLK